MSLQENTIAYLRPDWRSCDIAGEPTALDPSRGYAAWLSATGRAETGEPFYGLGRTFRPWATPRAVAYRASVRPSVRRHLPFEPVSLALEAAGLGQVPTTCSQVVALARTRPSCFLSPEVAAGAAFDALLQGLFPMDGSRFVAALVAKRDLADPEVVAAAEEGSHVVVCHWSFDPRQGDLFEQLAGARRDESPLFLAESEIGAPVPDLVLLPF